MQLKVTLLLGLLYTSCLALNPQFDNLVVKGRERMQRITAATTDTTDPSRSDDIENTWYLDSKPDGQSEVELTEAYEYLDHLNVIGDLGLSDKISSRYTYFPKTVDDDDDGAKIASYQLFFDPKGGAIVSANVRKSDKSPVQPDRSWGDVSWSLYKGLCNDQHLTYKNLKTVMSTDIQTDYAAALFQALWPTNPDPTKPLTYTNLNSDEALAILGLDTGRQVDAMLEYHNVVMGKKEMASVSINSDGEGFWSAWWTLREKDSSTR